MDCVYQHTSAGIHKHMQLNFEIFLNLLVLSKFEFSKQFQQAQREKLS